MEHKALLLCVSEVRQFLVAAHKVSSYNILTNHSALSATRPKGCVSLATRTMATNSLSLQQLFVQHSKRLRGFCPQVYTQSFIITEYLFCVLRRSQFKVIFGCVASSSSHKQLLVSLTAQLHNQKVRGQYQNYFLSSSGRTVTTCTQVSSQITTQ